jgi:hypothetical protein
VQLWIYQVLSFGAVSFSCMPSSHTIATIAHQQIRVQQLRQPFHNRVFLTSSFYVVWRLQAVRDSGDTAPEVHVAVDTLTFDRVLLFLEAQALHKAPPGFAIHLLDDLEEAGLPADQ